ncbi:adenosylcobinamide-phosphate synthase CbiB [Jeotgalibacillus sp. ET6]|uniref:adenosylcobinamide-phosphate synthase CbiB n=1 Tax=Jeotgalibacillus sp. ET6 TaxID=3037260 RepID=UPI0024185106|nr:adenosylcobinamide-phosphate synthase CbiB [Jeotgalibacillus sp. ET6]MDG5471135.1 adenosylcobinamide-phosphate synthase CbiB [Jeotgalibacillus sp. ET6]
MILAHLAAMTLALAADRIIGDPPSWPHPVRWIGSFILFIERKWNKGKYRKTKGVIHLAFALLLVLFFTGGLTWTAYRIHWAAGFFSEVVLITSALAAKSLKEAALEVAEPLEQGNLQEARKKLSWIVGRDTDELKEREIVRGTVETVAENTSDGITAPLFWAFLGGAPGIWLYKAINTGDSIVGYRIERFHDYGWAWAKMDDAVNWVPARITGWVMLLTMKNSVYSLKALFKRLPKEAKKHPSPNSGWGEAAVALLLNIKLGGMNSYQGIPSNRPLIGFGTDKLTVYHIHQSLLIMNRTIILFLLICWLGGIVYVIAVPWG